MTADTFMVYFRRAVLGLWIWALFVLGAFAGVGAGLAYHDHIHGRHSTAAAVAVGIGTALEAWLVAALLSLFVEIANSLRQWLRLTEIAIEMRQPE